MFNGFTIGLGILGMFFGLVIAGVPILAFIFWIFMLIDCVKRKFKSDTEKIIWVFVIIFTYIIGALIYYFIVMKSYSSVVRKINKRRRRR